MRDDEIRVQFVGNKHDTDKPWVVHGGARSSASTGMYKTKNQATQEAFRLGKRAGKEVVVETKRGSISERRDYRDNSRMSSNIGGGMFGGSGLF